MNRVLIGSSSHPAWQGLAAHADRVASLDALPQVESGSRVVVLVDYGDVLSLSTRLHALHPLPPHALRLVAPGFREGSPHRSAILQAAATTGAAILWHAPLAECLLHARQEVAHRRRLMLGPLAQAVPWLASADLVAEVSAWLDGSEAGSSGLVGPEPCDGPALARQVSALLQELSEPATFVRQRFAELDANADGRVHHTEAIEWLVQLGQGRSTALEMVRSSDLDGDGWLSLDEFAAGLGPCLEVALSRLTAAVEWVPVPSHLLRDDWVGRGLAFDEASLMLDHFEQSAVGDRPRQGTTPPRQVLREHALAFVQLYILPGRGLLTFQAGRFGDPLHARPSLLWTSDDPQLMLEATLSEKQLPSGDVLFSRRAEGGGPVEIRWRTSQETEVIRYGDGDAACAIELLGDQLVGLGCRGPWPALRDTMEEVVARRTLKGWQKALFRELGSLHLDHLSELDDPKEVICHCAGVTRGALAAQCEAGSCTLAQLAERTGVTQVCGGCTPVVEELLGSSRLQVAEILSKKRLGRDIFRITLRPVTGSPAPSLPGQHIVLQGRIHGRWVTRAYTLTSPGGRSEPYELTLKRDETGLFSRWLADLADESVLLRCSEPVGDVVAAPEESGPFLVFAGGIGITPGLALARTFAADGTGRRLHIDWSARQPADFVFATELDQLSGAQLTWRRRCTSRSGRLDEATLHRLYPWQDGRVALVCGPAGYIAQVTRSLRSGGWPEAAIRVEVFSSSVDEEGRVRPSPPPRPIRASDGSLAPVQTDSFFLDLEVHRDVAVEAEAFLQQMYRELGLEAVLPERLAQVRTELESAGTYVLTRDELAYGAQLAWRNSTRCIGRFFWQHLQVRDMRHLTTEAELFAAVVDHMRLATDGGDIVSTLTIFRAGEPTIRMWNGQLIRYAGYRQPDGRVVGDPANCELTERIQALGWQGAGGRFDVLPLVFQIGDRPPQWFELPEDAVLEVPLEHPDFAWFAELGLRWYALPAVSELAFDVGGIVHRCVPFNGFYMGSEIGARNLADEDRYNQLPVVAERMGLDCSDPATLWKDRALVELNVAVLHSFRKARVRMLDHHSLSTHFEAFEAKEKACGRAVYGDWAWLVPPLSGSTSSLFFRDDLRNVLLKPMFQYQHPVWERDPPRPSHEGPVPPCPFHHAAPATPSRTDGGDGGAPR